MRARPPSAAPDVDWNGTERRLGVVRCQRRRQYRRRVGVERMATRAAAASAAAAAPSDGHAAERGSGGRPSPTSCLSGGCPLYRCRQGPSRTIAGRRWGRHHPVGPFMTVVRAATGSYGCQRTRSRTATPSCALSGRHCHLLGATRRARRRGTHLAPPPPSARHHHRAFPVVRRPAAACCRRAAPPQGPATLATPPAWRRYGARHRISPAATVGSQRCAARGRCSDRSLLRCHGRAAPTDPFQNETGGPVSVATDRAAGSAVESPGGRGAPDALQKTRGPLRSLFPRVHGQDRALGAPRCTNAHERKQQRPGRSSGSRHPPPWGRCGVAAVVCRRQPAHRRGAGVSPQRG